MLEDKRGKQPKTRREGKIERGEEGGGSERQIKLRGRGESYRERKREKGEGGENACKN